MSHTDITICADRSGSISSILDDVIGGYNSFLKEQKEAQGTANITFYQFDNQFEEVYKEVNIQDAPELTDKTFVPRGGTALLDAIGRSVVETGQRLSSKPADHVVFVIITDGEENSSREYTKDKISEMLKHQQEVYNWQVVFLAANQDAIQTGASYGVNIANSMTYAANSVGTTRAFESTSKNLVAMRCGLKADMSYTVEDIKAQAEAGVNC